MKIRKGFVSNSSSSSFICEVCGDSTEGFICDFGAENKVMCVNGHIFCKTHAVKDIGIDLDTYNYKVPAEYCPICSCNLII